MKNKQKLQVINKIKQKIKQHPVIIDLFKEHDVDIDYLDYIPMGFADLPVSARTEHGIIWFNNSLLDDGFADDDHYMVHEITHVLQQCFGEGPTIGSNSSEEYLNNEFEQEGFQAQTEYMSDMYGEEHAENYVEKVLDHHNVNDKKERKNKLDELLVVARESRRAELLKLSRSPTKMPFKKLAKEQLGIIFIFNNTVQELTSKLGSKPYFDPSMNAIAKNIADLAIKHDESLFSQPSPDTSVSAINNLYILREKIEESFFNKTFKSNPFQESQEQSDYDIGTYEEFSQNLEPGLLNQIIYEIDKLLPKSNVPRNDITEVLEFSDYLPVKLAQRFLALLKIAGVEDVLNKYNVSDDIKQFISALPDIDKQKYIAHIIKNPRITIDELQSFTFEDKQSIDPYLPREKEIAKFWEEFKDVEKWILITFKKIRKGIIPKDNNLNYIKDPEIRVNWSKFSGEVLDSEFQDWYLAVRPDIFSYDFKSIKPAIDAWHHQQAQIGTSKEYQEGNSNIIYGPDWINPKFKGWTIKEIKTENDLQAEGFKMEHCVGGTNYCDAVDLGEIKVYSLRDLSNQPHITMEVDGNKPLFQQIKGKKNHEPADLYKEMIKEWISTLDDPSTESDYFDLDSVKIKDTTKTLNDLKSLSSGKDQYGLKVHISSFKSLYDDFVVKVRMQLNDEYYDYLDDYAVELAKIAVNQDKDYINYLIKNIPDPRLKKQMERSSAILYVFNKLDQENQSIEYKTTKDQDFWHPDYTNEDEDDFNRRINSETDKEAKMLKAAGEYRFIEHIVYEIKKLLSGNPFPKYEFLVDTAMGSYLTGPVIGLAEDEKKVARINVLKQLIK